MLHLLLTNSCNLNCTYCFSSDFLSKKTSEFSIENIIKVLDFMKTDGTDELGLVGGEPFLHSKIDIIGKILENDNDIRQVIIFSNGLAYKKHFDIFCNNKFKHLINCNSPSVLGDKYELLLGNLKVLNHLSPDNLSVGINLPYVDFDYSYIFDILKMLNKHILRFSFATSNSEKRSIKNPIEYFKEINPYIMSFYKSCLDNDIIPFPSCNTPPPCCLFIRDKKTLLKIFKKSENYGFDSLPVIFFNKCIPVIDVLPDLTTYRCLGLDGVSRVSLTDFSSLSALREYYSKNIDTSKNIFINSNIECQSCMYNKMDACKLCRVYSYES